MQRSIELRDQEEVRGLLGAHDANLRAVRDHFDVDAVCRGQTLKLIGDDAAVDSAAAMPPAATSAITQFGKPAISGLARTMMSRSTVSSLPCQP